MSKRRFKLAIQCLCVSFLKTREASTLLYISGVRSKSEHGQHHQLERRSGGGAAPLGKQKQRRNVLRPCATCVLVLDHIDMASSCFSMSTGPDLGGATAPHRSPSPKTWPPPPQKQRPYCSQKKKICAQTLFYIISHPLHRGLQKQIKNCKLTI